MDHDGIETTLREYIEETADNEADFVKNYFNT